MHDGPRVEDTMAAPERPPSATDDTMGAPEPAPSSTDDTVGLATPGDRPRATGPGGAGTRGEPQPGARVGRYVMLSLLGAGGMGVVYSAYDPELDRKVAVKLLFATAGASTTAHQRLVREAQALAQLSHPNVVTVYDVGEHDGRVYVAMELVDGTTFGEWRTAESRRWPEVVDVLVQAGRGLAAAHARGLIHRDFKPDNVMIGSDGRPRVMDFGLARPSESISGESAQLERKPDASMVSTVPRVGALNSELTMHGSIMGTPAYMAPEQHWGRDVGPAADQYAFCVTLWEALFGKRPVSGGSLAELASRVTKGERDPVPPGVRLPGWLRRACERGLAVDPDARWPDMRTLLDALSEGRAKARRGAVLAGLGAVVILGSGAVAWQQYARARAVAECEGEGASIDATWNDSMRTTLRDALVGTGVSHAATTAEMVMPWLERQADAWRQARTQACVDATVDDREGLDADLLDRSVWCLDERRDELAALLAELARGEPRAVGEAVPAVAGLPTVDVCIDRDVLLRLPSPPAENREAIASVRTELSKARALDALGAYDEGVEVARRALAAAEVASWPPLTASARTRLGGLLGSAADYDAAERVLEQAYFEAAHAEAPDVAVTAADLMTYTVGRGKGRHAEALHWWKLADLQRASLPDPAGLREATGLSHLAIIREAMGEYEEARTVFERALAIKEQALGPDHLQVAQSLNNLANLCATMGDLSVARGHFERALAIKEGVLGAGHPSIAISLNNLARIHWSLGEQERAIELLERALAIKREALGPEHPDVFSSLSNLALVNQSMGNDSRARELYEQAIVIGEKARGADHPDVAQTVENLGQSLIEEDPGRARELLERALAMRTRTQSAEHPQLLRPLMGLSRLALDRGEVGEAVDRATQAVRLGEKGKAAPAELAHARLILARALWEQGTDRPRAVTLAEQARDGWSAADGDNTKNIADAQKWLAAHR